MLVTYDLPLTEWISIGLNKKRLNSALDSMRSGESFDEVIKSGINNGRYIEKVLREEVVKQFSDLDRPMLEIALNSIDARPKDLEEHYTIKLKVRKRKFLSQDNGEGMSLEDILKLLIIPFSTEKTGIHEIGRFGVGFLSTFNYCLRNPKGTRIMLDTSKDYERTKVLFYSTSSDIKDLRAKIEPMGKSNNVGTNIKIKTNYINKNELKDYLENHIKNIPPHIARIFINRRPVNENKGRKWYSSPVKVNISGEGRVQQVALTLSNSSEIKLTSHGVLVKFFYSNFLGATISFPSAVKVVEGRDEFKIDENYHKSVEGVFKALEDYVRDYKKQNLLIDHHILEFIPKLSSSLSILSINDIPNLEDLSNEILPGKKYVLGARTMDQFSDFLGKNIKKLAFSVSAESYNYWKDYYSPDEDFRKDFLTPIEVLPPKDLAKKVNVSYYPNLHLIAKISRGYHKQIKLVELNSSGESAVVIEKGNLYINVSHPNVRGNFSPLKVYSIISDYFSLQGARNIHNIRGGDSLESKIRSYLCNLHPISPEEEKKKNAKKKKWGS